MGSIILFILGLVILAGAFLGAFYFLFYKKGERLGKFGCNDDGQCVEQNVYLQKDCDKKCRPKTIQPYYIMTNPSKSSGNSYITIGNNDSSQKPILFKQVNTGQNWFTSPVNRGENPRLWFIDMNQKIFCLKYSTDGVIVSAYDSNDKLQEIGIESNSIYFTDTQKNKYYLAFSTQDGKDDLILLKDTDKGKDQNIRFEWIFI